MNNTPDAMTSSTNAMDIDSLQRILCHQQLELETCEFQEHNTVADIDPDHFLSSMVNTCNYFTQEQYENVKSEGRLSIIHFNSQSLYAKFDSIKDFLQGFTHPFSIIAISETWFINERGINLTLEGYELTYLNREDKTRGGVAFLIHQSIKFDVVKSMTLAVHGIMECLTVEIYNEKKKNVFVSCVYRTPGTSIEIFSEWMEKLFSPVNQKTLFICGDFNIDLLNPTKQNNIEDFIDTMYSLSLYPSITKPSRITSHSATIIDNIFTNIMLNQTTSGLFISDISDHLPVFTLYDCDFKNIKHPIEVISKRIRNDETINNLNNSLARQDWSAVYGETDVDSAYSKFLDIFISLYDKNCPVKEFYSRAKHKLRPWLTKGIINACKKKNNLYKLFIKSKTKEAEQKYKLYKNKLTDVIRTSKQLYYRKKLNESKSNIKETWNVLNGLIKSGSSKSTYPDYFIDKNGGNHNMINIVNSFNNFFVNVGPELAATISNHGTNELNLIKNNPSSLFLLATDEQEVINTVLKCKNKFSTDYYNIDMFLVKNVIFNIAKPFTYICNLSFQSGRFPDKMKIAKVIPVFKNGNKHCFTNYRPISLLPQFSKILEKLFDSRLEKFLEKHNIINDGQYGFRAKRTTSMALIEATEEITTALDQKKIAVGVFIDLKKAFDTINHFILVNKLEKYGVRGVAGDWIKSYLTGRVQFVKMGKHISEQLGIVCGVPQGSVLGPKLFNVYINDIFNVSQSLKLILFADDTTIFYSSNDYNELVKTVNMELNKIKTWMDINKLSLNISKTKVMMFGNSTTKSFQQIVIEGTEIENVCENKFLGIVIDNKLTWKAHIKHIKAKISKSLYIINKVKQCLDAHALRTLYCTLVLPYLTYCVEVW
uniref:Reverse transcriptase domain-containing protein n=1 Tax=Salarias fasciatus TaxID=181472 RepID=A0A672FVC1_SALFA